jgi:hypothetical protein
VPLAVGVAVVPLLLLTVLSASGTWRKFAARGGFSAGRPLLDYLRAHTGPADAIFGDPVGELSVLVGRRPGARVGQLITFVNHDDAPQKFGDIVLRDLDERRCAVVVLPVPEVLKGRIAAWETQRVLSTNPARRDAYRAAWARLIAYVKTHYVLERADIDGRQIWRRKA